MELLEHYLRAVGLYLPRAQRDDILKELAANLEAELEERQAVLGRPLSVSEQVELLERHGEPMEVALRYGTSNRGLAFGRQLISPSLFPLYRRVLWLNWGITVAFVAAVLALGIGLEAWQLYVPMILQFGIVTVTYILIDLFRGKSARPWNFPPAPMQPIPRWQSVSGLACWTLFTLWWFAVPTWPILAMGSLHEVLVLTAAWHRMILPVGVLLLAGIAQRLVNLVRPKLNWLLPAMRIPVNLAGLALSLLALRIGPWVAATPGSFASIAARQGAIFVNACVVYGLLSWLWLYLLINVVVYAWFAVAHWRGTRRHRRQTSAFAL